MPDLKYFDSRLGEKYSGVPHYFEYASKAIETMFEVVGPVVIGNDGLMKRGSLSGTWYCPVTGGTAARA